MERALRIDRGQQQSEHVLQRSVYADDERNYRRFVLVSFRYRLTRSVTHQRLAARVRPLSFMRVSTGGRQPQTASTHVALVIRTVQVFGQIDLSLLFGYLRPTYGAVRT